MWQSVILQQDCDNLLARFGGFHDGCLREMHVWTEHSVNSELKMSVPFRRDTKARLFFQRQYTDPSAIELLFDEVIALRLVPPDDNCDGIILEATLNKNGEAFAFDAEGMIQVTARKLSWRDASNWMGSELRFGVAAS